MIPANHTPDMTDMLPHTDDSSKYGYPPGVDHNTRVAVILLCNGESTQHESVAQSFGWNIAPHHGPGMMPSAAPITHYRVLPPI